MEKSQMSQGCRRSCSCGMPSAVPYTMPRNRSRDWNMEDSMSCSRERSTNDSMNRSRNWNMDNSMNRSNDCSMNDSWKISHNDSLKVRALEILLHNLLVLLIWNLEYKLNHFQRLMCRTY